MIYKTYFFSFKLGGIILPEPPIAAIASVREANLPDALAPSIAEPSSTDSDSSGMMIGIPVASAMVVTNRSLLVNPPQRGRQLTVTW